MFRRQAYRQSIIYNCHLLTLLRDSINTSLGTISPGRLDMEVDQKAVFLEDLRKAVYAAILACFIQGLDLLARVNAREGWGVNLQHAAESGELAVLSSLTTSQISSSVITYRTQAAILFVEEIATEVKRC